jgi:hypothetical protein
MPPIITGRPHVIGRLIPKERDTPIPATLIPLVRAGV